MKPKSAFLRIVERTAQAEGMQPTTIPFLSTLRATATTPLRYGILQPSFCLLLEGGKTMHIGSEKFEYGPGGYVVSVIDLPTAGQVTRAPYLGVRVELDAMELASIVVEAGIPAGRTRRAAGPATFVGVSDTALQDCLYRLFCLVDQPPRDASFLAPIVKREFLYRLLTGDHGDTIRGNVIGESKDLGVGRAIHWLRHHFSQPLCIEELATAANMSVSSLHHKFKSATTMGPLQYQKHLRLQEARRLLLAGQADAGDAAFQVGYESPSQFSREYRRLFGAPPLQDVKSMRGWTTASREETL